MPNKPILAALLAVFIWGASPAATMLAAETIRADLIGGLRSILAAVLMMPAFFWFRQAFPRERRGIVELLLGGLAGFAAYPLLLSIGVALTSVAHASLILAAAPVFTGLISFFLTGVWPRWRWWVGALIAMAGITLLISVRPVVATGNPATMEGDAFVLLSVLFASLGYVFGGRSSAKIGKWPATFWMLAIGSAVMVPFIAPLAVTFDWSAMSASSAMGLAFLVIFVTIIGYALWFWALGASNAARIAPLQFGQPLVGVALAVVLFGEPLSITLLISGLLIVGGVVLSTRA